MKYDEWAEITNTHEMAISLGYECWEDVPIETRVYVQHRLAEAWINYKASELELA